MVTLKHNNALVIGRRPFRLPAIFLARLSACLMINLLAGLVTGRCLCTKLIAEMNDVIDSGAYFRLDKCVKKSANMSRDTGKMWIIPSSLAKLIK